MSISPYPLHWPAHIPRTKTPERSRFHTGMYQARLNLERQLDLLGARNVVVTSNAMLNKKGTIAARQPWISDVGIAVYFTVDGQGQCFACDRWDWMEDNIQAIAKTIEALRGIQRWGTGEMVEAAFKGFAALPEGVNERWWTVLGIAPNASRDAVERAYRSAVKVSHPDQGGDVEAFHQLQQAYEQALAVTA